MAMYIWPYKVYVAVQRYIYIPVYGLVYLCMAMRKPVYGYVYLCTAMYIGVRLCICKAMYPCVWLRTCVQLCIPVYGYGYYAGYI